MDFVTGGRSRERLSATRRREIDLATTVQKITLSASLDIPFNKLVLSQSRLLSGPSIRRPIPSCGSYEGCSSGVGLESCGCDTDQLQPHEVPDERSQECAPDLARSTPDGPTD